MSDSNDTLEVKRSSPMSDHQDGRGKANSSFNGPPVTLVEASVLVLDEYLEEVAEKIKEHLCSEVRASLQAQMAIGRLVLSVQADGKYGEAAVEKLATRLGLNKAFLQRLGARALAFNEKDIATACELAEIQEYSLGPSILDELVPVKDHAKRQLLLEQSIEECWTVQQLRGQRQNRKPSHGSSGRKAAPLSRVRARAASFRQSLAEMVADCSAANWSDKDREQARLAISELEGDIAAAIELLTDGASPIN